MCYNVIANTKRGGDNLESVFRNIRAECARNSMSIEALCRNLGIERKTFYNWEAKKDFPTSYLVRMATIFCVTTDALLGIAQANRTTHSA